MLVSEMAAPFNPNSPFAGKKKIDLNGGGQYGRGEAERLVSASSVEDDSQFELKLRPPSTLSNSNRSTLKTLFSFLGSTIRLAQ